MRVCLLAIVCARAVLRNPIGNVDAEPIVTKIVLTNGSSIAIAFKLKTTAPKRYTVKPNSGIIEAKTQEDITSMFLPVCPPRPPDGPSI